MILVVLQPVHPLLPTYMLSSAHTLISLPIGFYLTNPLLIFITAALVHLLCDTLLHWNIYPDQFKRYPWALVALDVTGGLVLGWLLLGNDLWHYPVLAAIAGGNAPDVLQAIWEMLSSAHKRVVPKPLTIFFSWHHNLQNETTSLRYGLPIQISLSLLAIATIFLI